MTVRFRNDALPPDVQDLIKRSRRRWPWLLTTVLAVVSLIVSIVSLVVSLLK